MDTEAQELLNNREIAVTIWLLIALLGVILVPAIRSGLRNVLRAFFKKQIQILICATGFYVGGCVAVLHAIGLWHSTQLKTTLLWAITVGFVSLFRIDKASEDPDFFKKLFKDNLKATLVIEFISSYYTFSLPLELVLFPVSVVVVLLAVVAEREEKYKALARVLTNIIVVLGAIILFNALYKMVQGFREFLNRETFSEFSVPIALSVMYIPFLYGLSVFLTYERAFVRMRYSFKGAEELLPAAKVKAVRTFRSNTSLLLRWLKFIQPVEIRDQQGIDESFRLLREMQEVERAPLDVPAETGWCPHRARLYLRTQGVQMGDYNPLYDGKWMASSASLRLTNDNFGNSVRYYVEGTKAVATKLSLELNVNEQDKSYSTLRQFAVIANCLHKAAVGVPMLDEELYAILERQNVAYLDTGKEVLISYKPWPNGERQDFEIEVQILMPE